MKMKMAGELLLATYGEGAVEHFSAHPSDTVRGWAGYTWLLFPISRWQNVSDAFALLPTIPILVCVNGHGWQCVLMLQSRLRKPFRYYPNGTNEEAANLRRFAVEITGPRGVWCAQIA